MSQPALSRRITKVTPSLTLSITAKAKALKAQGIDVISLSAGEPDFDTPEFIKEAAIDALRRGVTKYTPAEGTLELRKAIAEKLLRDQGLKYTPEQIVVSAGAKHSIFNLFQVLFVAATSSAAPNAQLALTVPGCVTQAPMLFLGDSYFFLKRLGSCGNLDGTIATVGSSLGGSDTETIR